VLADYDLAVEQARESGNTLLLGTLLSARAGAQSMNGAFGRALSDALEAQRLLEALGEDALNAIVLQNAGIAYRRMGEYGQAEEYLLRSLAHPEIQGNWVYRLITLLQLGYLFEETDRFADARRVIGEALELCPANEAAATAAMPASPWPASRPGPALHSAPSTCSRRQRPTSRPPATRAIPAWSP
jgi:tetratricopeptide (TPR) repeat protein